MDAIASIAAHCERCSPWCSNTRATARSLTSGGYLRFLDMTSSSQGIWSPSKPGRFIGIPPEELLDGLGWDPGSTIVGGFKFES